MKPKTKLQMEIVNGSKKLAPVSEAQKRYAYKHCFVHYFKRDAKNFIITKTTATAFLHLVWI